MIIREIPYGSREYEASKRVREEILRLPLGLQLSEKDIEGEDAQIHIIATKDDTAIVGVVLLKPLPSRLIKLRQMAVGNEFRGTGLGRQLVQFAEKRALAGGFKSIEMHARIVAQGFYEKLGYRAVGEPFTEVTVATIKMVKAL